MLHLTWVTAFSLGLATFWDRAAIGFTAPGGTFLVFCLGLHRSGSLARIGDRNVCIGKDWYRAYHRHSVKSSSASIKLNSQGQSPWEFSSRMTGEGLEPSTHGLTYLTGFHRPWRTIQAEISQIRFLVESLDYIITISGVSRLVSEADSLEAEGTSPADHPILTAFHAFAVIVTDPAVACEAIRAFQQFATCTSNGWFISVEGSHYRLTPTIKVRCSTNWATRSCKCFCKQLTTYL